MVAILAFGITLLVAVLVSRLASRSVLSTAVLFLAAGFVVGNLLHLFTPDPRNGSVRLVAELALVSTLFSDGTRARLQDLKGTWELPSRALLLGLPLTIAAIGAMAHWLVGLDWREALLVGTVLGPTDPVFAAAIIRRQDLSVRLRRLLNVESGMNDGLAFPILLVLLFSLSPESAIETLLVPTTLGLLLGAGLALIVHLLERMRPLGAEASYRPMAAFALGVTTYALAKILNVNEYLAAFGAGATAATLRSDLSEEFKGFAEDVANVLKFAALFLFGALISPALIAGFPWQAYLFAVLALVAARPIALALSLIGARMDWRNFLTAAWFGPKGFASVVYAILVLERGISHAPEIFHLAALVITLSIVAHSSTDVLAANWLLAHQTAGGGEGGRAGRRAPAPPAEP